MLKLPKFDFSNLNLPKFDSESLQDPKNRKKLIQWGTGAAIVLVIGGVLISNLFPKEEKPEPKFTGIEVRCDVEGFEPESAIDADHFTVVGLYDDGSEKDLGNKNFTFSPKQAPKTGGSFFVSVTSTEDKNFTDKVKVKNLRNQVEKYAIGYPSSEDVYATVYDNGELEFSGKGGVKNFKEIPWKAHEGITTVTILDGVTPENMDNWFSNMNITSAPKIPASVTSLYQTFSGCAVLEQAADTTEAVQLADMTETYTGCTSLVDAGTIPGSVIVLNKTYRDCSSLVNPPNLSQVKGLQSMQEAFSNCVSLSRTPSLPNTVWYLTGAFSGCINLKETAIYPEQAKDISSMYADCSYLETSHPIPVSVETMTNTYSNCRKLHGKLEILTTTDSFSGFLSNVAQAGLPLTITGDAEMVAQLLESASEGSMIVKE